MCVEGTERQLLTAICHLNHIQNKWNTYVHPGQRPSVWPCKLICVLTEQKELRLFTLIAQLCPSQLWQSCIPHFHISHCWCLARFLHGYFLYIMSRIELLPEFMICGLVFKILAYLWLKEYVFKQVRSLNVHIQIGVYLIVIFWARQYLRLGSLSLYTHFCLYTYV